MRMLLLLGLFLLPSCSLLDDENETPEVSETKPKLVGRVALVPPKGDFVLIESYGPWRIPDGGLLSGMGPERASTLVSTGEKLGQHVAADIRSGTAKVGDSVYFRPVKDSQVEETAIEVPVPSTADPVIEEKKDQPQIGSTP